MNIYLVDLCERLILARENHNLMISDTTPSGHGWYTGRESDRGNVLRPETFQQILATKSLVIMKRFEICS